MKIENESHHDLDRYLESTELCDWRNPSVVETAERVTQGAGSPEEKALRVFHFVRDEVVFSISDPKSKASQTLKRRAGECGTKTNLQIALLRASGIPARFHASKCRSEALKGIIPDWLYTRMPAIVSHFWTEVHINGRWLASEGLFDKPLFEALLDLGLIERQKIPSIEWDGETSLILLKHFIVDDLGIMTSYDDVYCMLDKQRKEEGMPPRIVERLLGRFIYYMFKRRTDRIREA
ncbi:MAG: transglutaminase domain-containing protein [Candidatus Thorarchaeota archaeon]|nr:MAG: transglutaminase domain-containing protein [Candidatus Thorarchaeota archaeon]